MLNIKKIPNYIAKFLAIIAIVFFLYLYMEFLARIFPFQLINSGGVDERSGPVHISNLNEKAWSGVSGKYIRICTGVDGERLVCDKPALENKGKIIILGDSFSEGLEYNQEDTYSGKLKDSLSNLKSCKYSNFDVINYGVAGTDSIYNYLLLKNRIIKNKPKVVIGNLNIIDDIDANYRYRNVELDKFSYRDIASKGKIYFLNSKFLRLVDQQVQFAQKKRELFSYFSDLQKIGEKEENDFHDNLEDKINHTLNIQKNTKKLIESNGGKYFVVLHGVYTADDKYNNKINNALGILRTKFDNENIDYLDVSEILRNTSDNSFHIENGIHLNLKGHKKLADSLLYYLCYKK